MSYREKAQARAEALLSRGQGYVLAVESSCDETAAAVVDLNQRVYSNVVASSAKVFEAYGGVVPEIASRKHMELLPHVVEKALCDAGLTLDDIDCVAGTMGPGLVGALLCGLSYAKALAFGRDLPFIGVNHMEGHIAANPVSYTHLEWKDARHVTASRGGSGVCPPQREWNRGHHRLLGGGYFYFGGIKGCIYAI